MRIGKIAEKTGVSRDAIRLYERMGLLKDISRPHKYNNYKEYNESNIERIKFIISLKKMGFTLKECLEILETFENGQLDENFQKEFIAKKINEINNKINELLEIRKTFEHYKNMSCSKEEIYNSFK